MLHLLKRAVDPGLKLERCINDWHSISRALRESPRKRGLQVEKFNDKECSLS